MPSGLSAGPRALSGRAAAVATIPMAWAPRPSPSACSERTVRGSGRHRELHGDGREAGGLEEEREELDCAPTIVMADIVMAYIVMA